MDEEETVTVDEGGPCLPCHDVIGSCLHCVWSEESLLIRGTTGWYGSLPTTRYSLGGDEPKIVCKNCSGGKTPSSDGAICVDLSNTSLCSDDKLVWCIVIPTVASVTVLTVVILVSMSVVKCRKQRRRKSSAAIMPPPIQDLDILVEHARGENDSTCRTSESSTDAADTHMYVNDIKVKEEKEAYLPTHLYIVMFN